MTILQQAITDYLTYCENQKKLSTKSIKAYAIDLEQLKKYTAFGNIPVKTEISAYIAYLHKTYSPRTVKRKIASIRAFLNYLEFEEFFFENPMKKIKTKFHVPQTLPRTIPLAIIEEILRVAYQEFKKAQTVYSLSTSLRNVAILELLFATGVRVSELCSLNVESIDLDSGKILIMGKGAKERVLQIGNPEVLSVLRHYAEKNTVCIRETGCFFVNRLSSRISEQSVRFLIKRLCAKADVGQNITPHMFRHSFATLLLEEDVDIRYIQRMLGHSSILTTQIYTQVTVEKQRQILTTKHPRNKIVVKMNMTNKYRIRFDELENQLNQVENTKHTKVNGYVGGSEYVDNELFIEWKIKVKNLLVNACGKESEHYLDFVKSEKPGNFETNNNIFLRLKAVFHAAKEDYLGGYLSTVRDLVQAELFDDELEQVKELLDKKYHVAAAIIAGVVLETGIRELCKKNNIETGKLNKMNDDLAKNGVYNSLIQKQIIALAGIRNSAAHGKTEEFTIEQVENMIKEIETLLAHNLNG